MIKATINDCPTNVIKYWWGKVATVQGKNCGTGRHACDLTLAKLYRGPIAPLVQALDDCLVDQQQDGTTSN
jgi:hypothetical protein